MNICCCTIVKDQQLYLEEWINHMLNIGFDTLFIYEEEYSKPHNDIVDKYKDKVILTRISSIDFNNDDNYLHQNLYNWFIRTYKDQYDWCLFCNIDSYLMFEKNYNLKTILDEYDYEKSILIKWKVFNASGHINRPSKGSLIENYTLRTFKTEYINNGKLYNTFVHISKLNDNECFENNNFNVLNINKYTIDDEPLDNIDYNKFNKCWLNVYYTKSWEDWIDFIYYVIHSNECQFRNENCNLDTFFILNNDMIKEEELLIKYHEKYGNYNYTFDRDYVLSYKYDMYYNKDKIVDMKDLCDICKLSSIKLNNNEAVLFLTSDINKISLMKYENIRNSIIYSKLYKNVYFAVNDQINDKNINTETINFFKFNYSELNNKYGKLYYSENDKTMLFQTHYVLLDFCEKYNYEYDYVWLIEDDVLMSRNSWDQLFKYFENDDADFISSHISPLNTSWINNSLLLKDFQFNKDKQLLQSFNPIFRISKRAVKKVVEYYKTGNNAFFEFGIVNIVNDAGYVIEDFGGEGSYVKPKNINKWYIKMPGQNNGSMSYNKFDKDTVSYLYHNYDHILIHKVNYYVKSKT